MVYTNEIIKTLEKECENANKDITFFKGLNKELSINSEKFDEMRNMIFQFYINHKKGFVDNVEFEDGMITINKFLNLFPNKEIDYEPAARAVKYLLAVEETNDESEESDIDTKIEIVKKEINKLQNNISLREQFGNELIKSENNEYGSLNILYDFDENELLCMPIPTGTINSNYIVLEKLPQDLDFEEMIEDETFDIFVENLIESLSNMSVWIYYDENGEKTRL